jgi:hypothetical protein
VYAGRVFNKRLPTLLAALGVAIAISACGGGSSGNGVEKQSATEIVTAATQAIEGVTSVHVAGSTSQGNSPVKLDLTLVAGKGGQGNVSVGNASFQIVTIGSTVYLKAGPSFWSQFGNKAAATLLQNRWLKAPISGNYAQLAQLTDLKTLFGQILSTHGSLTKGSTSTVNGQQVVAVTDKAQGGTLYVATTGKPYPIEIQKAGTTGGTVTFDKINSGFTLTAPAGAVAIPSTSG